MDHFAPDNSSGTDVKDQTFIIPLMRMRGKNATQNVIINPGGPGGSGLAFIYEIGEALNTILGEGYHVLSFDPRGVNGSVPKAECYPDEALRRANARPRYAELSRSGEMYAWNKNLARACYDTMGEHAKYINTPQTAADMNHILDAVGQEDMLYWGFSYGTILGQTYATMYPERSRRVVIDGVANVHDWYSRIDTDRKWVSDSERVLYGFFDECVKAGPARCPLATFGDTPEDLRDLVWARVDETRDQPLSVYVNNTVYGTFDYANILTNAIFYTLYAPHRSWGPVADQLAGFLKGNATDLWMDHGRVDFFGTIGEANRFVTFNDAKSGAGYWPQGRQELLDEVATWANQSRFSLDDLTGFFGRQHIVPQERVETAHPLLILTTSYDPVCPIVGAFAARNIFVGSQIIE
ncbi:hypothetical protein Daus18300_007605 [Diaporthe australafricana]|uniref:AB hydrolase-1 domain-containing protein n=1 Tax=Diaporthe australafricana TaxID=127596 RepID=A0ABR3WLU6_9PEZI